MSQEEGECGVANVPTRLRLPTCCKVGGYVAPAAGNASLAPAIRVGTIR